MSKHQHIVWLASYPKSGNTWFRIFLTNLLEDGPMPADINNLYPTTIASSRQLFDDTAGIPSADLLSDETEWLRPAIYNHISETATGTIYHKIHDAWFLLPDGTPLIPPDATNAVLYFIRNPLDVAISLAHHNHSSIDTAIDQMNNPGYCLCGKDSRLHNQVRQQLMTWSMHVESWVDKSGLPVCVIRYEDMHDNPLKAFGRAAAFAGIDMPPDKIEKAVADSRFEITSNQEREKGFKEKAARAENFFRKGIKDDWQNTLSPQQVETIRCHHEQVMRRFGYLT